MHYADPHSQRKGSWAKERVCVMTLTLNAAALFVSLNEALNQISASCCNRAYLRARIRKNNK